MVKNKKSDFPFAEIGERITWAIDNYPDGSMTQKRLGEESTGVTQASVAQWITGKTKPKSIEKVAFVLQVNSKWLETGIGSPHQQQHNNGMPDPISTPLAQMALMKELGINDKKAKEILTKLREFQSPDINSGRPSLSVEQQIRLARSWLGGD